MYNQYHYHYNSGEYLVALRLVVACNYHQKKCKEVTKDTIYTNELLHNHINLLNHTHHR